MHMKLIKKIWMGIIHQDHKPVGQVLEKIKRLLDENPEIAKPKSHGRLGHGLLAVVGRGPFYKKISGNSKIVIESGSGDEVHILPNCIIYKFRAYNRDGYKHRCKIIIGEDGSLSYDEERSNITPHRLLQTLIYYCEQLRWVCSKECIKAAILASLFLLSPNYFLFSIYLFEFVSFYTDFVSDVVNIFPRNSIWYIDCIFVKQAFYSPYSHKKSIIIF